MLASSQGTLTLAAQPLPGARPLIEGDTMLDVIAVAVLVTITVVLMVLCARRALRD